MADRKKPVNKEEEEILLFLSRAIWLIVTVIIMFGGIYFISH